MTEYTQLVDDPLSTPKVGTVNEDLPMEEAPKDKWNLAYLIMVLLGAGTLFSYNAVISAADYFDKVYPKRNLKFLAPLCISIFSPPLQGLLIRYGNRWSYTSRIVLSYVLFTILISLIPVFPSELSESKSYYLTLMLILGVGASTALVCSAIFGFAAMFPMKYIQALMAGQGWSGVAISIARIISKASFPETEHGYRSGAIVYFALAAVVSFSCIFAYYYLINTEFSKYYIRMNAQAGKGVSSSNASGLLDDNVALEITPSSGGIDHQALAPKTSDPASSWLGIYGVTKELKVPIFHILLVFIMTFITFPGLLTSIPPHHFANEDGTAKGWLITVLVTEFNVFDLVGRSMPNFVILFDKNNIIYPIAARFILYPLFFLCVKEQINHFVVPMILNLFFAISNGYLSSLVMMSAPSDLSEEKRPVAGGIMSLFLNTGILTGSLIALAVQKIAKID